MMQAVNSPSPERHAVDIRTNPEGDRLVPAGPFDLPHAAAVARAVGKMPAGLEGCRSIDVDLAQLDRIDGAGAVLLARLLDRLDASGRRTRIVEETNPEAARLIALYRRRQQHVSATPARTTTALARIGAAAGQFPGTINDALDFVGRCAAAVPKAVATPGSVDWRSLPRLLQEIGADGLVVTGAANLLVGLIIGLLGISQLSRFGAVSYVPELVVVAQFRELGPLVTAIVVAGRSGAGLASELATMKVGRDRCVAGHGVRPGAMARRAALPGARDRRAAPDLDRQRAIPAGRVRGDERRDQYATARVPPGHC
jgi:phospholipid/cholesterol/gamma-HCH transport system permease protein